MLITLTPGGTGRREKVAPQIQEVAPTDSRGGPHHVCGVTLCSVWHFSLCGLIQEVAPLIQEVARTDSRGGPHHVYGVALCSVWHFALCGEWILEVAPTDSRGGPHHVYGVALNSIQDPPDASTIVGYILVIPTPGMLCRTLV